MSSEICKESFTELLEMSFADFFHMEQFLILHTAREAERAYNRYLMQKQ